MNRLKRGSAECRSVSAYAEPQPDVPGSGQTSHRRSYDLWTQIYFPATSLCVPHCTAYIADAIFDGVGTSAAARDTVVDSGLVELEIATEKRGASASVILLVGLEPQNRTSRQSSAG